MGKTRDLFKNIRDTKGTFHEKMGLIKDRNGMDITYRFKGLDLIDRVSEELWTEVCNTVQKAVIKTNPKKKNAERQNGCLRRPCK